MHPVTLLIGIVSFRSGDILLRCLESIHDSRPRVDLAVCVVDNDPSSGDGHAVRSRFPHVTVIDSPQNVGFGAGMNRAYLSCPSKYFLILNPDTEVQQDALDTLVGFLDAHPSAGAVGPQLRYPDGSLHPSAQRFPRLVLSLLEVLDLNLRFPNNRFLRYHTYEVWDHLSSRNVDWVTGAALMVRSELFRRLGGFDERFFMYSEEVDLCRRIRNANFEVAFSPDARIVHLGAHTTRHTDVRQVEFYKSLHLYFQKHHGQVPALAIRLSLFLRQMVYIPAICARYLFQIDRTEFWIRIRPALRLLAWILGLSPRRSVRSVLPKRDCPCLP